MRSFLFGHSGLRVSEICLGTMTFGTEWGWGSDYETSKAVFDAYAEAGGYFIDTANRYTEGTSEKYVGEFIRSERDHFVLATKYSLFDREGDLNHSGNHRKNLMRSVEGSLRRLGTDFVDLLWLHAWDFTTGAQEVMRGLDDLVRSGKVHYLGISDTPAWIVAQANTLAQLRGWTAFAGLQVEYSLVERTPERELLPMAKAFDLALTPWAPLGAGILTGKYLDRKETDGRLTGQSSKMNERNLRIARTVVEVASKLGASPAQVAINWTRQGREQVVIPIVGARTLQQLEDSLGCLHVQLPEEALQQLDAASAVAMGFPHEFLQRDGVRQVMFGGAADQLIRHR